MSIALWVFILKQAVAQVPGIKVKEQHPRRTRPQQAAAARPTSPPSYTLPPLLSAAAQSPLHPLKLARALVRPSQRKPRHPLLFAL
jgi:hypothetical protein